MKQSIIALLLTGIMLASMGLTSCGGTQGGGDGSQAGTSAPGSSESSETTEAQILPATVDKKYDGYKFRVYTKNIAENSSWNPLDVYAEEESGDLINDAVYRRNGIVEEKYDVEISMINVANPQSSAGSAILAGDDFADALYIVLNQASAMAGQDYLYDLSDVPLLDITKPWWDTEMIENIAINNRIFILSGDLNLVDNYGTWCIQYNKRLAEDYKCSDIYKTVRAGGWTMDVLEKLCKSVTRDLDGDNKINHLDQWGMVDSKNSVTSMFNGAGCMLVSRKDDGTLKLNTGDTKVRNVMERLFSFFSDREMQMVTENLPTLYGVASADIWTVAKTAFTDGRALFRVSVLADNNSMRAMEDDFGMVPMPKFDESQDSYWGSMQAWNSMVYAVPKTASDIERTAAILEYFSFASVDTLTPAYFDTVLAEKVARDEDSIEMLNIIFDSRIIDLGLVYNWGSVSDLLKNSVTNSTNTISSDFASAEPAILAAIATTYEAFTK